MSASSFSIQFVWAARSMSRTSRSAGAFQATSSCSASPTRCWPRRPSLAPAATSSPTISWRSSIPTRTKSCCSSTRAEQKESGREAAFFCNGDNGTGADVDNVHLPNRSLLSARYHQPSVLRDLYLGTATRQILQAEVVEDFEEAAE